MKKIIIGNWKMNPLTSKEAEKLFRDVTKGTSGLKKTEVVICAPFIYLEKLKSSRGRNKNLSLGAQDAFWGDTGAFTGEVSVEMLDRLGVKYVILGHSERRFMGESNSDVNKKIKGALGAGLIPIVCVGEKERDDNHAYFNVVKSQIEECLAGVNKNLIYKIIIAYEPVWSISSTVNRRDATSVECREMAIFIRKILSDFSSPKIVRDVRIIYGGSANEKDAQDFLSNGGVDGLLAGRASLNAQKFIEIVKIAEQMK